MLLEFEPWCWREEHVERQIWCLLQVESPATGLGLRDPPSGPLEKLQLEVFPTLLYHHRLMPIRL
jgi:hypothetical protein